MRVGDAGQGGRPRRGPHLTLLSRVALAMGVTHRAAAALPVRELLLFQRYFDLHPPDLTARVVARFAATQVVRKDKLETSDVDFCPECYPARTVRARLAEIIEARQDRDATVPAFFQRGLDGMRGG